MTSEALELAGKHVDALAQIMDELPAGVHMAVFTFSSGETDGPGFCTVVSTCHAHEAAGPVAAWLVRVARGEDGTLEATVEVGDRLDA
jgi:hypothetical protein